jgi:hypothetical protein
MALRIRTVISPRSLIASVERGSFSRRMDGGIRRPWMTDFPGDVSDESSGNGYARYVAGFVVLRDFVGEGGWRAGDVLGSVGRVSSVNLTREVDEMVRRW